MATSSESCFDDPNRFLLPSEETYFKISENKDRRFENGFYTIIGTFCILRVSRVLLVSTKKYILQSKLRNTFSQNAGRFFR